MKHCSMIKVIENNHDGVLVENSTLPITIDAFKEEITLLIKSILDKKLLWIKIPIEKSHFIPVLTKLEFDFHHCDEKNLMLVKKLSHDAMIPPTKNYMAGVGAIVFNEGQLLVIKDRFTMSYKLPGGYIDKNESIKNALKREVYEETGINIEFESIVNIGHFRHGQFEESSLYIVCTAKDLSKAITINDISEIADARWMDVEDFLTSDNVNIYNRSVVKATVNNTDLKLTEQHLNLNVPDGEVFY